MAMVAASYLVVGPPHTPHLPLPKTLSFLHSICHKKLTSSTASHRRRPRVLRPPLRRAPLYQNHQAHGSQNVACEQQVVPEDNTLRYTELISMLSAYNAIRILEVPENMYSEYAGSRILLLDESGNIHSIYKEDCKWTGSYWDQFATLPAIIPEGPIAILGLGGGTAARLILDLWPSCKLEGWEVDEILVDMARMYLGLSDLEIPTALGGQLQVHVGDALLPSATADGGLAGIMVDLFAGGEILPQLQQPETWIQLRGRLRPGGRIMINCGGICVEKSDSKSKVEDGTWTWEDGGFAKDATLRAMSQAFPGELNWRELGSKTENFMALTGPLPDLEKWAAALPEKLQHGLNDWKQFQYTN